MAAEATDLEGFRPSDDRMEDAIAELQGRIDGGEGSVRAMIYRIRPDGEKIYLSQVPAEIFSLDMVRDQYGGGEYAVSVSVRGRRGIPPRSWRVRVEAPPGWTPPEERARPPEPAPAPAESPAISAVLEQLTRDRDRSDRMLESLLASLRPPDPAVQMQSMLAMVQAVQSLTPAVPVPVAPPPAALDGLALTERVLEMARTLSPRGETSSADVLLETVKGIVPVLREALVDQRAAPPVAPVPAADPVPDEDDAPRGSEMVAERMFLAQLIAGAESGQQPSQWIAPVLRVVSAEKARRFLSGPDAIDVLAGIDERVPDHEKWFRQLGTLLVAQLDQEDLQRGNGDAAQSA